MPRPLAHALLTLALVFPAARAWGEAPPASGNDTDDYNTATGGFAMPAPGQPEQPRGAAPDGIARMPHYVVHETIHQLPPFVVTGDIRKRWWYAAMPRYEILSCATEEATRNFAQDICRQEAWLDEMALPDLQGQSVVPTALIVFGNDLKQAMAANIATLSRESGLSPPGSMLAAAGIAPVPPPSDLSAAARIRWELLPQVTLWDEDSTSVEITIENAAGTDRRLDPGIEFDPEYVFHRLQARTPPLPAWFSVGLVTLYQMRLTDAFSGPGGQYSSHTGHSDVQYFMPAYWISSELTDSWRRAPSPLDELGFAGMFGDTETNAGHADPRLIPARELLTETPPRIASDAEKQAWLAKYSKPTPKTAKLDYVARKHQEAKFIFAHAADPGSPWRRDLWNSESLLLVRWALDDPTGQRSAALWRFAGQASAAPADEAMLRGSFGFGYGELDELLAGYLKTHVLSGHAMLQLVPDPPLDIPDIELREPSAAEKARLLGDWQRKEVDEVRASDPQYAGQYAEQAYRTLMLAYDQGARDPSLLAAIGLLECSLQDDGEARRYLEPAVQARVARPQAYVELARIRLAGALARPAGRGQRLDRAQVASVLVLLQAAGAMPPPQRQAFLLATQAWEHADFVPESRDLAFLDQGLAYFPGEPRLILAAAQLDAAAGMATQAVQVLDRGLRRIPDPAIQRLFAMLRHRYARAAND